MTAQETANRLLQKACPCLAIRSCEKIIKHSRLNILTVHYMEVKEILKIIYTPYCKHNACATEKTIKNEND
jgi:hypothetical protein